MGMDGRRTDAAADGYAAADARRLRAEAEDEAAAILRGAREQAKLIGRAVAVAMLHAVAPSESVRHMRRQKWVADARKGMHDVLQPFLG